METTFRLFFTLPMLCLKHRGPRMVVGGLFAPLVKTTGLSSNVAMRYMKGMECRCVRDFGPVSSVRAVPVGPYRAKPLTSAGKRKNSFSKIKYQAEVE